MNPLRKLAGQTAVYGLSSIIGRVLNYLLTPLLTRVFSAEEFGVNTEMYVYVSFFSILLTYGMETTFFRFSQTEANKDKVYSTSLISIVITSCVFVFILIALSQVIANIIQHPDHPEYIIWFALILGLDAISAIPFAKLREERRAERFTLFKLIGILVTIGLTLFFLVYCPYIIKNGEGDILNFINAVYNPEIGIGYVFISNLIGTIAVVVLLLPDMFSIQWVFDKKLWKKMLHYSLPLLIVGIAGMINETLDRILLKYLLPQNIAMRELGIYGASYKLAMMMTIFIQAFRFAAEPFFFSQYKEKNPQRTYALLMKYFVIVGCVIFLGIMLYMDIIKYFVGAKGSEFHEGLGVVPILLIANLFLGIYFNLSIWYKLTGKTRFGALISLIGAVITITLNVYLIPRIGYMGSAWATLICYVSIATISFFIGQKYYPVKYNIRKILFYILLSLVIYFLSKLLEPSGKGLRLILNSGWLMLFMGVVYLLERPKKNRKLAELKTPRK